MSSDFLSRWSRRKQQAAEGKDQDEKLARTQDRESNAELAVAARPEGPQAGEEANRAEPTLDLSKLPSLDDITAATDMRVFMQPGVPASLARAALRRAWAADPAIRDFVGLAENSWDFTAPGSIPGFGSLEPEEVSKLLTDFLRGLTTPLEHPSLRDKVAQEPAVVQASDQDPTGSPQSPQALECQPPALGRSEAGVTARDDEQLHVAATQKHEVSESRVRPRSHGRALPE